jgi:hypothetical protein
MKEPLENFDYSNEPQFICISKAAAIDLAKRYTDESQPLLTSKMPNADGNLDARSIVFPIEKLKKFIWEIENSVRKIPNQRELGIRAYFGKYPDIAAIKRDRRHPLYNDLSNLPDEYSFHHTLFLVPTFKDENNIDRDFDPWQSEGIRAFKPIKTSEDQQSKGTMTAQMNHGNICPPPFTAIDKQNRNNGLAF